MKSRLGNFHVLGQAPVSAYAKGINQGLVTSFWFSSFLFLGELIVNTLRRVTNFSLLYRLWLLQWLVTIFDGWSYIKMQ